MNDDDYVPEQVKIKVRLQGSPIVNWGYVHKKSDDIVCFLIDLRSKYCEVIGSTGCGVMIGATDNSLFLDETHKRDDMTWIEFPDYEDWSYFAGNIGRYTLSVCLIKDSD